MNGIIFSVGLAIFLTYMYFLVKMINTQHKIQEKENGKSSTPRKKRIIKIKKENIINE